MVNWKLKACTRCGGDLFIDRDIDGWFTQCFQCSKRLELVELNKQLVSVDLKCAQRENWSKQRAV